jgi:LacI family transcriptional regulator
MRTTIKDIANKLGLSVNTVSKALNGKKPISEKTRELILLSAVQLNYTPNETARAMARRELRIAAVYPQEPREFYQYVVNGIKVAAQELLDNRCHIIECSYPSLETPEDLRKILISLKKEKIHALILTCSHHFDIYRSELEKLGLCGVPIFYNTIFGSEEIPSFTGGIRMDTFTAGRMAAEFLALVIHGRRRKKVALFTGDSGMLVHRECIEGFHQEAQKYDLEVAALFETREDHDLAYRQTGRLMKKVSDLAGIYVTSYNALGVCGWFDAHPDVKRVPIIGHDLYPKLNEKLRSQSLTASLFQNQAEFGRQSVLYAFEYLTGMRKKEDCVKKYLPQIILGCMADSFPEYDGL